jgi:hypothetical protein
MVHPMVPDIDYEGNTTSFYYADIDETKGFKTSDIGGFTSDPGGFNTNILWISGVCLFGFVALTFCCISIVITQSARKKKRCVVPMPVGAHDIENRHFPTTEDNINTVQEEQVHVTEDPSQTPPPA